MMGFLGNLWRDLKVGARLLRRDMVVTSVAVGSLALGIGVNTSVFSTLYTVAFKPLPFRQPEALVHLHAVRSGSKPISRACAA